MNSIFRKLTPDEVREIRDLQEEVDYLKRTLTSLVDGSSDSNQHWQNLDLTASEVRVLRMLLIRTVVPREVLLTALYWDKHTPADPKILDVFVSKIRRKLPWLKDELHNRPGVGRWLTPEGKHRLLHKLEEPTT